MPAPSREDYVEIIRELQRRIDRLERSVNPIEIYDSDGGQRTTTSTSPVLLTNAPSIIIPFTATYLVRWGFLGGLFGAANGGSAVLEAHLDGVSVGRRASAGVEENIGADGSRFSSAHVELLLQANEEGVLDLRARQDPAGGGAGGTAFFEGSYLIIRPVRTA